MQNDGNAQTAQGQQIPNTDAYNQPQQATADDKFQPISSVATVSADDDVPKWFIGVLIATLLIFFSLLTLFIISIFWKKQSYIPEISVIENQMTPTASVEQEKNEKSQQSDTLDALEKDIDEVNVGEIDTEFDAFSKIVEVEIQTLP